MDVDSTLTTTEGIDLLAAIAGAGNKVAAITERAMQGELDFGASLRERVALLAGLPEAAIEEANAQVNLGVGAVELIAGLNERGIVAGLVSGGFTAMVDPLARRLGIERFRANTLEVSGGRLTGRLTGSVVDRAAKACALREWAVELGIAPANTVAMGDGANDLDMMAAAGFAIAFHAKPAVAASADATIDEGTLTEALALIDAWNGCPTRGV
jgi:phosphoserine phosphatase